MAIMTRARFHFNQLMVTLISSIRASEPPPPPPPPQPGERRERPGLTGLTIKVNDFRPRESTSVLKVREGLGSGLKF